MPFVCVLLHYNSIMVGGKHAELMCVQHYVMGVATNKSTEVLPRYMWKTILRLTAGYSVFLYNDTTLPLRRIKNTMCHTRTPSWAREGLLHNTQID